MEDTYQKEIIKVFTECQDDEEIGNLINKVYEDGFEDGYNAMMKELEE